jgi:hypothetical protein
VEPDRVGLMIGRVAGVALLALGISCWSVRTDSGGAAVAGTRAGITFYNAGAGVLLVLYAVTGQASGFVVWGVGAFHLALAAGLAASLRRGKEISAPKSRI